MKSSRWLACLAFLLWHAVALGQSQPHFGDDASTWANDDECDDPRFVGRGMASTLLEEDRFHDATDCRSLFESGDIRLVADDAGAEPIYGRLERSDRTLGDGEFVDEHGFYAEAGDVVSIDLRSSEFDTYLFVTLPDGEQHDNDDFEGDQSHSSLTLHISQTGKYRAYVTSYSADEVGEYSLTIGTGVAAAATPLAGVEERGELGDSDATLSTGEFYDEYHFYGSPGERVRIDLRSNAFDTYLIVVPPKGDQLENDDGDSTSHSFVELDLDAGGEIGVLVTSYESGETGDYLLTINHSEADDRSGQTRDPERLFVDQGADGRLEDSDPQLDGGEYSDVFEVEINEGDAFRIELASQDFDTYLAIITPSEDVFQNDDFDGSTNISAVELLAKESGTYRVIATSYDAAETGEYKITVNSIDPASMAVVATTPGRLFGLFAGISDYPGKESDLAFTAQDAVRLRDAMVSGAGLETANQVTLLDEEATRASLRRAIADIARQARPEDTFVFFFSGHGDRVERADGPDVTDPDALDETIELYDGPILDDELRDLFADIHAGTSLIFLDSCFSGGFAKDIISVPGRMGLFSSEEDVTSSVAAKFQAGGYLSLFLADAIEDKLADSDGDNAVSAIELSQYVYERYRADVKADTGEFVRTGGPQSGHQHLVVDRGSIGPYDILFR